MDGLACCGCGGRFAEVDAPTHPYMPPSPGCWACYGQVLARQYVDYSGARDILRLTVDAYAVQHPHAPSSQNTRSIGFHLCRLCLLLERGLDASRADAAMAVISAHKSRFIPLPIPASLGEVTVADVHAAASPERRLEIVRQWAAVAWEAWTPCHQVVRGWVAGIFPDAEPGAAAAGEGR
ncbi:MAG TPA: DUF5946 family protein [Lacipirellulaceae bacterium]|nr:DUF5946 family protein [Lacipirellulaceae bacterium]